MCPLSVRSHPEPTAINASFVQALLSSPAILVQTELILCQAAESMMGFQGRQRERGREVRRGEDLRRDTRGTGGYLVLETGAFIFPPAHVQDNVCLIRAKRTWGSQLNGLCD